VNIAVRRFAVLGLFPFAAAVPLVQAQDVPVYPRLNTGTVTPNPATTEGEVTLVLNFMTNPTQRRCEFVLAWGDGQQGNVSTDGLQLQRKFMHPYRTIGRHTISASGVGTSACLGRVQVDVTVQAPRPRDATQPAVANAVLAAAATARGVPTAVIKGTIGVQADSLASFDGSGSTSVPPGHALAYAWDFGDGATATGAKVSHRYRVAKEYSVTLVVTDGVTRSAPAVSQLRVAPPPSAGAPKHP